MLLGTATVYKIGHKFNHGTLFLLGLFIDGASFCFYYFIETLNQLNFWSCVHGIGIPFLVISRVSIMQKNIPEKLLGRIFAIISVSILSMTAVSSGIIGFLAEFMSIHEIFLMIRRPPRSTLVKSSPASDVYKRQLLRLLLQQRQTIHLRVLLKKLFL